MKIDIPSNHWVACLCEGPTEAWIIEQLLEENALCFTPEQLLGEKCLFKYHENGTKFANTYLTFSYEQPLDIIIVQDSKKTSFSLPKPYQEKINEVYYAITHPEIEMLMIHALGMTDEFYKRKSKTKPSQFIKDHYGKSPKTKSFLEEFYQQYSLKDAIETYGSKTQKFSRRNHYHLANFLVRQ